MLTRVAMILLGVGACCCATFPEAAAVLPVAATGANVDESRVTKILYVDPAHTEAADDDKHGTADAPFATLGYACELAAKAKDANVGVKLVLANATYREAAEIRPPAKGAVDTEAPLVIEAAEREQAVIDGADTEGWSPSTWKVEDARWTHSWPFRRGAAAQHPASPGGEAYQYGDLVLINGMLLRQVNTPADLAPGRLWVPPPVENKGRRGGASGGGTNPAPIAMVQPPEDTELAGSIIQVGVRSRGLTITGRRNVVVRGLLVQHAAQPGGNGEGVAGLAFVGCTNVLIEDVLSQWNDGAGMTFSAAGAVGGNVTLRRVRLLHNGGSGLLVTGLNNLLAEDCESSFNHFRGDWTGWIDPHGAVGIGVESVHGSTWRRQHVVGNACRGWSLAGENANVLIEDAVIRDNSVNGLLVEANPGPVLVRRCVVTGTKQSLESPNNPLPVAGIFLVDTPDVTLESNLCADNAGSQLALGDGPGKAALPTTRHVYRHNVFYSADADANLYRMPGAEAEPYYATLDTGENCFWNPAKSEVFEEYPARAANRKAPVVPSRWMRLDAWQANGTKGVGGRAEAGSLWQDPRFVDPGEGDYRLKNGSPVADWDLPSDETAAGQ